MADSSAVTFAAIEQVREALFHATRSTSALDRAPVPGTPIGDAHLNLDAFQALAEAAARTADNGHGWRCDITRGATECSCGYDALHSALARVRAGTQHPLGRDETGGTFEGEAP